MFINSANVAAQQNILIYSGPGAGPKSLANTVVMLKQIVADQYNIVTVDADTIINPDWMQNTALLVMPGGADRPYLEKLAGKGNANIRQYVANGGKYLGICAGSYYAADRIEFAKGDSDLEVTGERELKFFPGLVSGPTYLGFDHRDVNNYAGTRAAKLSWQFAQGFNKDEDLIVFYNGGGHFVDAEKYPNVIVLARYRPEIAGDTEQRAAIVEINFGKGKALLSGPHFEWDPYTLDEAHKDLAKIKPSLINTNQQRIQLARYLLSRMGICDYSL